MALFGSIFKGRSEKKEEPKAAPAPASTSAKATPLAGKTAAAPVKPAPAPIPAKPSAGKTAPGAPQKPMQLDEIVAALQQIESIMSEPSEAAPGKTGTSSEYLQTVSLALSDVVQIAPASFNDMQVSPEDKVDVVIENLFGQMAKGKIETTIGYLLAGVPKQYLVNPGDLKSELKVSLPLPLVVASVNPDDFKKRTARARQDRIAAELPNLFPTVGATAEKPAAAAAPAAKPAPEPAKEQDKSASLSLKLSDLSAVMPSAFKSGVIPPDAKVDVPVEDVFGQLAKGKVEVPVNKLLAGVPKQYLSAGATLDAEVLIALPLAVVVAAVPPDELMKRTAAQKTKPMGMDLPDLFKRADGKEAPAAAAPSKPEASAAPRAAPPVPKAEPKAAPVPEAKPVAQAQPAPKAEAKPEPSKPKLELKTAGKGEPKAEAKPAAPAIPVPKVEPKPAAPAPKVEPKPVAPPVPKPAAPAPKAEPSAPVAKAAPVPPAPKVEPKPVVPPVPKAAPAPVPPAAKVEPKPPAAPAPKPEPKAEPVVPFAGPAPKKFMPIDLVAALPVAPTAETPVAPKAEKPKAAAPVAPPRPSVSGMPVLMLRGLDLNQASAGELMRVVDGIGEAMAQHIVQDRTENGPFFGLYDLGRVPGIGSKIYEKITGQPWLEEKYGQLHLVDELLGRWTGKHPDLKDVAAKFKAIPGFEGCMILHRDGDLLATSWQVDSPERLQAMAPQILKKVKHYMRHIAQGETYSVTVFQEGVSFTFVESEDICFVAVQNPKGLSRRHIQIVNGLGVALGRRFSGYRGA